MITFRIPPDINAVANRYALEIVKGDTKAWFDIRDAVAKAIYDERQRCADIVESFAPGSENYDAYHDTASIRVAIRGTILDPLPVVSTPSPSEVEATEARLFEEHARGEAK